MYNLNGISLVRKVYKINFQFYEIAKNILQKYHIILFDFYIQIRK